MINSIEPDFVRLRRLWLFGADPLTKSQGCPLLKDVEAGTFIPQTDEGTVVELQYLLENLEKNLATFLACDHSNNFVQGSPNRLFQEHSCHYTACGHCASKSHQSQWCASFARLGTTLDTMRWAGVAEEAMRWNMKGFCHW